MEKGFIYIFTGNGKGKTSAALGICLRAAGAKLHCLIIQFMKLGFPYSELESLKALPDNISLEQFADDAFVIEKRQPTIAEKEAAMAGLRRCEEVITSRQYDLIVLDEVCAAVYFGMIEAEDVARLFPKVKDHCDLIITGRYCPEEWIESADVVTEMKEIKHYYKAGVLSRKGLDC